MSLNQIPDFMLSDETGSVKDKIAVLSGAGGVVEKTNKSEFDAYKAENAINAVSPPVPLQGLVKGLVGYGLNSDRLMGLLQFCKNNGKTLFIPDGDYYLDKNVVIDYQYVTIIGQSMYNTRFIIKETDNFNIFTLRNSCNISDICIKILNPSYSEIMFDLKTITTTNNGGKLKISELTNGIAV